MSGRHVARVWSNDCVDFDLQITAQLHKYSKFRMKYYSLFANLKQKLNRRLIKKLKIKSN